MDGADVFIQVKAVELFEECADAGLLPLVRTQQPALQQRTGGGIVLQRLNRAAQQRSKDAAGCRIPRLSDSKPGDAGCKLGRVCRLAGAGAKARQS